MPTRHQALAREELKGGIVLQVVFRLPVGKVVEFLQPAALAAVLSKAKEPAESLAARRRKMHSNEKFCPAHQNPLAVVRFKSGTTKLISVAQDNE